MRLPTGSRRVDAWSNNFFERPSKLTAFFFILRTPNASHRHNFPRPSTEFLHGTSRIKDEFKTPAHFIFCVCSAKTRFVVVMSTRISRVRDVISAPLSAFCKKKKNECTSDNTLVGSGSRNTQFATSPRSGIWLLRQIHSTSTFAFRPFLGVSIARGCLTWSVPRLLGATRRWKSVLSQLFRTFVPLFAQFFNSRLERERLLFLLASSRPLDCEAVIRVGTLSLVQFVGLTVIAVRLMEKLPKRGSRDPTEQM